MNINEIERSFTESELVKGAELYYSGELKKLSITKPNADKPYHKAKAEVCEFSSNCKNITYQCKLDYFAKRGVVLGTSCTCDEFSKDKYGCRHVAALLTAVAVSEQGNDFFKGSKLESNLKSLTLVDEPLAMGAVRRTDARLLGMMENYESGSLPTWQEKKDNVKSLPLKSQIFLHAEAGDAFLEMKLGSDRTYVIKKMPELISAYQNGGEFLIGKNNCKISNDNCDEQTAKIMKILADERVSHGKTIKGLFSEDSQKNCRFMKLYGKFLDKIVELFDGEFLDISPYGICHVDFEHKGLFATVKRNSTGATLRIEKRNIIFSGADYCYILDNDIIFRLPFENDAEKKRISALLSMGEDLYIRESDIQNVYKTILPLFEEYGTVASRGLDSEDYEREKPKFKFELDYESSDLTCKCIAAYPVLGNEYIIFKNSEDANLRNIEDETKVAGEMRKIFNKFDAESGILAVMLSEGELFNFLRYTLPEMEKWGEVSASEAIIKSKVKVLSPINVGLSVNCGRITMSLKGKGLSKDEMHEILQKYDRKKKFFRLSSGNFISIENSDEENELLETCSDLYRHYGEKGKDEISIPAYRALSLQEIISENNANNVDFDEKFQELCEKMTPEKVEKRKVPESLENVLRPYQRDGFQWISCLKKCGFGGILADDMGLGKTLQVIAFLLSEKLSGKNGEDLRTLVVCPASLVYNWEKEIEKFAPELSTICILGSASYRENIIIKNAMDKDVWITSYDLLKRDILHYKNIIFANEIIDEAQYIKNNFTQNSQSVRAVKSSFRLALTGTPIENKLSELWSIMDYLMPGFLYEHAIFQKEYEAPILSDNDARVLSKLRKLTHPFILRRLKKKVLKDLPDKIYESISVHMEGEQREVYDALAKELQQSLEIHQNDEDFLKKNKIAILAQLTKLRETCCDPSLLYANYKGGSAKLDACLQLIQTAIEGGHKILLFSQFTSMLDIICEKLSKNDISYHRIDGSVSKEDRMTMVDSFAEDDVPVFCISLKAGGTGLNLTAADIVIHYDPWWNMAAQEQATDRAHRIGQKNNVTVYELICDNTLEQFIQEMKEKKKELAEDVLSGDNISSADISRDDIMGLLKVRKG